MLNIRIFNPNISRKILTIKNNNFENSGKIIMMMVVVMMIETHEADSES